MTTQENYVKETEVATEKAAAKKESEMANKLAKVFVEAKNVFSIQNLTLSLLSVLLVIGIGYLSNFVSEIIANKIYAAPMMSLAYSLSVMAAYFLAILGPAILYAIKSKKWESVVYIVLLEIVWFAVFIAVLYYTTPEKKSPYEDLVL